jgi:hypothetical protein
MIILLILLVNLIILGINVKIYTDLACGDQEGLEHER